MSENLISILRNEIEKLNIKCYSPDFPQNDEMCCCVSIQPGEEIRALNGKVLYSKIPVYLLVRGNMNDKDTRKLCDNIYEKLDLLSDVTLNKIRVILITCKNPNYAFRDENQRIYYNIDLLVQVEREE